MTAMDEERQAYRLKLALDHGLKDIAPASARRLEAARHLALSKQKSPEQQLLALGNHGGTGLTFGHGGGLRQLLAVGALLLGMWLSFYWHGERYVSEVTETDHALLTDELPHDALLDKELLEWLIDDSSDD